MFKRFKLRLRDMRTISKLISGANKHAHMMGEEESGAEHFLLSALNLPDATALRVFERMGADTEKLKLAIKEQYSEALRNVREITWTSCIPSSARLGTLFPHKS